MFKLLRNKFLISLSFILFYKLGTLIPMPGLNAFEMKFNPLLEKHKILEMFIGGGKIVNIFYMGIFPWVISNIMVQMLTFVVPSLEKMRKEGGEKGTEKIDMISKVFACIICIPNAIYFANILFAAGCVDESWSYLKLTTFMSITSISSCMIITWLGQHVNEHGIGSGSSLIISVNIISGMINKIQACSNNMRLYVVVMMLCCSVVVIIFDSLYERLNLFVPRFIAHRGTDLFRITKTSCYLPLKLNYSGIMGAIFASSFIGLLGRFSSGFSSVIGRSVTYYYLTFSFLVFLFSTIYSLVNFSVDEMSKNLARMPCVIKGVPGGSETEKILIVKLVYNSFINSLFLIMISVLPALLTYSTSLDFSAISGTNLFIIIGTANEVVDHIKAIYLESKYS